VGLSVCAVPDGGQRGGANVVLSQAWLAQVRPELARKLTLNGVHRVIRVVRFSPRLFWAILF
jgi:hypothetical protein